MTDTEIKLILLDYKNLDYIPELGGMYIQNFEIEIVKNTLCTVICPMFIDINSFLIKYNLLNKVESYRSLLFYMNLLNFNGFSDWKFIRQVDFKFEYEALTYYQFNLLFAVINIYRKL